MPLCSPKARRLGNDLLQILQENWLWLFCICWSYSFCVSNNSSHRGHEYGLNVSHWVLWFFKSDFLRKVARQFLHVWFCLFLTFSTCVFVPSWLASFSFVPNFFSQIAQNSFGSLCRDWTCYKHNLKWFLPGQD